MFTVSTAPCDRTPAAPSPRLHCVVAAGCAAVAAAEGVAAQRRRRGHSAAGTHSSYSCMRAAERGDIRIRFDTPARRNRQIPDEDS